ncbi:MAG: UvrD-helicase domain-containing protein [Tenericutes bacterium]|nr:UvrD-helicase domain-containing protein [Mycoplasmatota bacterium]
MEKKICGYYLDKQQLDIVYDDSRYLLVVAGAGSGKTLTILGKIYYLVEKKKIDPNNILCISFTRASANSLKEKIEKEFNYSMPVYTFHKLSLEILKNSNNNYEIADSNTLENIIHEFFSVSILEYPNYIKLLFKYFRLRYKDDLIEKYNHFYKYNYQQIELLEKLLATFLHLFKCNNYKLIDFNKFLKQISKTFSYKKYIHEKYFLILALNFYIQYQEYLVDNKEIDFDDMIYYATNYIKENGINKKFKYVIIDEYQDTSYVRFCLVREILNAWCGNLMVVGDDFQSIYRFTGCDVSLFLNFKEYFNNAKIMKIENTYRNSQELIKIAGNFVMKNPKQIKKNLHSGKHLNNPVKIIYYDNFISELKKLIEKIYLETNKPILILGRNNKDINMIFDDDIVLGDNNKLIYKKNSNINIYFMTVHKSKGLEEENVIIINLENKFLGFPNQIKDDKILRLVSKQFEKYPYSEERRLFYVALTRTKNYTYLLTPKNNKSIFISEIEQMIDK